MSYRWRFLPIALLLPAVLCLLQSHQTHSLQSNSFLLPLSHTISATNSSLHHLLKSSAVRSATRHGHRQGTHRRPPLSLPLSAGSDYTLSLSVGPASSPTTVSLFMDTGSDIVWFPCSPFECILCEGKPNPNLNSTILPPPADSRLISCASPACSVAHSSLPSSDLCAAAKCPLDAIETSSCSSHACPSLYYAYGDGSLLAHLRHGRLSLASSKPNSLSISNFTFACAHSALAEPVGVAGFGRGPLSLPAQLSALSPSLSSRFSYCLVSHSFHADRLLHPSPLILGRSPEPSSINPTESAFVYTPLLQNPKHPYFYSVALESIYVGPTKIPALPELAFIDQAGNGGMVVDSGTTFTMLPEETFSHVSTEFARYMSSAGFNRTKETEAKTGLSPCYYFNSDRGSNRLVPSLAFHFKSNATVELPRRNYFLGFKSEGKRVGCLMLMNGGSGSDDTDSGPAGTLGNFQQQGFEVVYDLEGGRVGFARRRCTALWDSLARG
jgi:Xylanase inhibitor C-terminal/Xylanase inhibitor N-terminal